SNRWSMPSPSLSEDELPGAVAVGVGGLDGWVGCAGGGEGGGVVTVGGAEQSWPNAGSNGAQSASSTTPSLSSSKSMPLCCPSPSLSRLGSIVDCADTEGAPAASAERSTQMTTA